MKTQGHPWAVCTANFACLYYQVAKVLQTGAPLPDGVALTDQFFTGAGVLGADGLSEAGAKLVAAGDAMLEAIIYHSDHLRLSEQFDAETGYEKSVQDLTWSYSAFANATRARALL
jgi:glucoamylase